MNRISTIDVMRGLVMVVMALDHVRDLFHLPALTQNPTDLATTTAPIFLTRWITHLCAPTFVFLSGTSAYLSLRKGNNDAARPNAARPNRTGAPAARPIAARYFLFRRGVVLILLEITVINFALWFDIQFRSLLLQVIYAIGGGLMLVSLLARLPVKWLGVLGLIIVFGHDALRVVPPFADPTARFLSALLFRVDAFSFSPSFTLVVGYPLIPWLGIMLLGYACGPLLEQPMVRRRPVLLRSGLAAIGLFVLLRFVNGYGDAVPWSVQKTELFTVLSFINVSKYPPSLLYSLLLPGIMLVGLSVADGANNVVTRWLTVYGKVPLFYYIIHWYVIHLSLNIMILLQGYRWADIPTGTLNFGRPADAGLSLGSVYLVWLGLIAALYPLCRWYGSYKVAHPEIGWLRYI